ncbi:hypothetical protein J3458_013304 [Metarhizium acridum]|uniref:uncharacterized protein n=1 Tax=Metarhizium acridum TaxID=92637 RepID=UPI001C6BB9BA|nr:hypothetical protein J3458_013304 [Metarhizium acridum]
MKLPERSCLVAPLAVEDLLTTFAQPNYSYELEKTVSPTLHAQDLLTSGRSVWGRLRRWSLASARAVAASLAERCYQAATRDSTVTVVEPTRLEQLSAGGADVNGHGEASRDDKSWRAMQTSGNSCPALVWALSV